MFSALREYRSPSSVYEIVATAISNKQPLAVEYDGKPERLICPHVLGRSKTGLPQALCYQFDGYSSSGLSPDGSPDNWRCVCLDKVTRARFIEGTWHTAPNHSRPQTCVKAIDLEVTY